MTRRAACAFLRAAGSVNRPARGGAVDPALELEVRARDLVGVALLDSRREAPREGLDRRAVAQILEPLPRRGPDALLLLLDVRHA